MTQTSSFAVIIPAAGSGSRFGGGDKLLVDLGGLTVLQRSVALFAHRQDVCHITLVTAPDRFEAYRSHLRSIVSPDKLHFVPGGRERWESVLNGLRSLSSLTPPPLFVGIHDAARPLTPPAIIDEAFRVTVERDAALPCLAEPATLKRMGENGCVAATIDRRGLYQAQTPQCFNVAKLLAGFEKLHAANQLADVTDDAQVFERNGWPVPISTGSPLNLKITTAADVELARAIVASSTSTDSSHAR